MTNVRSGMASSMASAINSGGMSGGRSGGKSPNWWLAEEGKRFMRSQ